MTALGPGSRFLMDAESRYATIELELLAVAWAVLKCRIYLAGLQHFQVFTDHHPLIPIPNSHRLEEIENPRLQRLKTRLMGYNLTAIWIKGKANNAPDTLSRNPVHEPQTQEALAEHDEGSDPAMSIQEIRAVITDSLRIQDLRRQANNDEEYKLLQEIVLKGFPEHRSQIPEACKPYWSARHHLTVEDDLITHGCCLLIPRKMRRYVLSQLHESHQGSVRTKQRARLTVYWPGIDTNIDNTIQSCKKCQDVLPSNVREPMMTKPKPERPFQEIAGDLCSYVLRRRQLPDPD